MTNLPVLLKSDFSVRAFARLLRGYRRAVERIVRKEIARKCSFRVYDRTGNFWGYSSPEIVMPVSAADANRIAPLLLQLEDRRFYQHGGLDWRGFARAAVRNIQGGQILQGGSTLSMQLVRNTLIEPRRSLLRKAVEAALARKIESRFSKEEILRLYCEQVFLGGGLRGFQSAAFFIYRKPLAHLQDAEICGLLGLLRAPDRLSPYRSASAYHRRQKFVSRLLTADEHDFARPNPVRAPLMPRPRISRAVRREAEAIIGDKAAPIKRAGTTLDSEVQKDLDAALRDASLGAGVSNVSAIILDNKTGDVLAESAWERGGEMEFSPALEGLIQPGSTFKTFALIAALEQGIPLECPILSAPFQSESIKDSRGAPWTVRNYGGVYRGEISLLRAFVASDNCAFARLAEMLDHDRLFSVYRKFGVLDGQSAYAPIVLGATKKGVSMAKLALAYQAIANNGALLSGFNLTKYVESQSGELAWTRRGCGESGEIVASAEDIESARKALRAAALSYGMPHYWGKTGTTNSGRVLAIFGEKATCVFSEIRAIHSPAAHETGIDKSVPMPRRIINKITMLM